VLIAHLKLCLLAAAALLEQICYLMADTATMHLTRTLAVTEEAAGLVGLTKTQAWAATVDSLAAAVAVAAHQTPDLILAQVALVVGASFASPLTSKGNNNAKTISSEP
jgi:hypothetical protein